jgi:group I intron endonuclease
MIKNLINNKIYIGCSIHLDKRFNEHINNLIKNKHENRYLQNSFNKYGKENFIFDILIEDNSLSQENLWKLEEIYIRLFNTTNSKIGYNLCFGGQGTKGRVWSKDEKEERSILAQKLNYADRLQTPHAIKKRKENIDYSFTQSQEFKNKISKAMKGRVFTEQHIKNKSLAQIGGKNPTARKVSIKGKIYECIMDAAKEFKMRHNTVFYRINSNSERFKDWFYIN